MTKKFRFIILLICIVCFFVIAPILVFYSMGYRLDFKRLIVTETGGIYVRSIPSADQVVVDSKIYKKPGFLNNWVFVQSLIPEDHSVLVTKDKYYDYTKTIPVEKKEVTKLEHILLIKKDIQFAISEGIANSAGEFISPFVNQDKFLIKNSNLYYSTITENSKLTALQKSTPIIKKLVAFSIQNNNILWLGSDGFMYKSNQSNPATNPEKITTTAIKISKTGTYKIINDNKNIFLINNGNLMFLNEKTSKLDDFYSPVKDARIAQADEGSNIVYFNDNNIFISPIPTVENPAIKRASLYKSNEKITGCVWLDNSNIIFTSGNKILISEIDYRGHINNVTLPQTITVSADVKINLENPQIFFSQSEGKLYILNNKILISSERINQ